MKRRHDSGATLVLTALLLLSLCTIVAIVIDLGFTRSDRRGGQASVDNAASSSIQRFVEDGASAACEDAFAYLSLNLDSGTFAGEPCTNLPTSCGTSTAEVRVTRKVGDYTAVVVHPVTSAEFMGSSSTIGATAIATSAADGTSCERIGVSLTTSGKSFFGGVVGINNRSSRAHAVALARNGDPTLRPVPAFLLLERTGCRVLETNTGVNSDSGDPTRGGVYPDGTNRPDGIFVAKSSTLPGYIHIDSDGSECTGPEANAVISAASPSGLKTVYVEALDASTPGSMTTVAATRRAFGGVNVVPGTGSVISRRPVDQVFQSAIRSFHTEAYNAFGTATTPDSGRPPGSNRYDCDGTLRDVAVPPSLVAYIDCDWTSGGPPKNGFTLTGPTTVVFRGPLVLTNRGKVNLPTATRIVVRGGLTISGSGGENWAALQAPVVRNMYVNGSVTVSSNGVLNLGAPAVTSDILPTCVDPAVSSTRLAIFSTGSDPALNLGGRTALCATTVYTAGPRVGSAYTEKSLVGPTCALPCPLVSGNPVPSARYVVTGEVNWHGPSVDLSVPSDNVPLLAEGGIEDLAYWGESAEGTQVSNGATFNSSAVFFTPNSAVSLYSGGASNNPVNAQFIARTLFVQAGRFTMKPTVAGAISVPPPPTQSLIR